MRVAGDTHQVDVRLVVLLDPPDEPDARLTVFAARQPFDNRVDLSVEEAGVTI